VVFDYWFGIVSKDGIRDNRAHLNHRITIIMISMHKSTIALIPNTTDATKRGLNDCRGHRE
jgi:hypothetical protein